MAGRRLAWLAAFTGTLLVLAGTACVDKPKDTLVLDSKQALHDAIVGTWSSADVSRGYILYFEKTYFEDGTSCGFFLERSGLESEARVTTFRGTWRLEKRRLISTVTRASAGSFLTPGKPLVDEVISVNRRVMTLHDVSEGTDDTSDRLRIQADRGNTLCELKPSLDPEGGTDAGSALDKGVAKDVAKDVKSAD